MRKKDKMWKVRGKAVSVLNYLMMTHVKIEVKLHTFPTPSLGGNEFSAICPDRLITGNYKVGSKIVTSTRVCFGHWNLLPV